MGEGVSVRFWCHGVLLRHITSSPGEKSGGPARKLQKVGKKEAGGQKTDIFTVEDKKSPPFARIVVLPHVGMESTHHLSGLASLFFALYPLMQICFASPRR